MKLRSFLTLLAGFSALLISAVLTVALPLHSLDSPTGAPSGISAGTGVTPTWATGRVDAEKTFSISNRSLAADSNNHLHAAYGQDRLYYAFNGGADWQLTTVDYA
ncbi:MAG: hypothetical protein KF770_05355 [Anaerolineae bacterium]|nr:hypothetical protein [Anaerolineae bacterium]